MYLLTLILAGVAYLAFRPQRAVGVPILFSITKGSIAGLTFQGGKGGQVIRAKPAPTNPNTDRQQETRAVFASMSSFWAGGLNQGERDAWDAYAEATPVVGKLGTNIYLTGHMWFVKINSRLIDADLTRLDDPPVGGAPPSIVGLAVAGNTPTECVVHFTTPLAAGNVLVAWATPPKHVGSSPNFDQARLVGYSAVDAATPIALTLPWTLQVGHETHWYIFQMTPEGILSAAEADSFIQ